MARRRREIPTRPNLHSVPAEVSERSAPDDVMVSYRKALDVLTVQLSPYVEAQRIQLALLEAVPAKQRRGLR